MVVSETLKGMSNAAAATAIAATQFHPVAIINGDRRRDPALKVYDIVLGKYSVNLGAFKTPAKALGKQRLAAVAADGSVGFQRAAPARTKGAQPASVSADPNLLAIAQSVKSDYRQGKVVEG